MKDLSGNAKDGTITGTTIVPGKYGSSRQFNGGTDIIKSVPPVPASNSATFAVWVNRDSTQADSVGTVINNDRAGKLEISNVGVVRTEYHDGTYCRVTTSPGTLPPS